MRGSSWRPGCPVPMHDLRLVRLRYWGFDDRAHRGRLVVHRAWSRRVASRVRRAVPRGGSRSGGCASSTATGPTTCGPCVPTTRARSTAGTAAASAASGRSTPTAARSTSTPSRTPTSGRGGSRRRAARRSWTARRCDRGMIGRRESSSRAFADLGWGWGGTWTTRRRTTSTCPRTADSVRGPASYACADAPIRQEGIRCPGRC